MIIKKISIVLAISVSLSLVFTFSGCSGLKNNGIEAAAVDQSGSLTTITAGKLTVVGSGGYRPFNYIDDNGKVIGFDVDTGMEIAKRLGLELHYVTSDWDGVMEGLRASRYDAILGSMTITQERAQVVDFTIPYYYSGAQLIVRKNSGITAPSELNGKKIGVALGTTYVNDAKSFGAEAGLYQDENATVMELIAGRVEGAITDRLVALECMSKISGGEGLTFVGGILRLEEMGIAVNKANPALLAQMNQALEDMHSDGTLKSISEKWFGGADITVK